MINFHPLVSTMTRRFSRRFQRPCGSRDHMVSGTLDLGIAYAKVIAVRARFGPMQSLFP
jgi:hypothetical protein